MAKSIAQALFVGKEMLKGQTIDAQVLLGHVMKMSRLDLITKDSQQLTAAQWEEFMAVLEKRQQHCPVSKIIGKREFFCYDFIVNENVLDPRPDSELMIEIALDQVEESGKQKLNILDLGTGSGCLLYSTLLELQKMEIECHGIGVDICDKALEVAKQNAYKLGLDNVILKKSNWLDNMEDSSDYKFDVILSNPPYINSQEMQELPEDVNLWDPHLALHGGQDGLDCYRAILAKADKFMTDDGILLMEMGNFDLFFECLDQNIYALEGVCQDLAGKKRVAIIKKT